MDYIIGGQARLGQGWKMLMTALAAGRGISLPSLSSAGAAYAARTTGAYARIREQFGISISKFEGIEEPLARIAATAYLLDAARRLTCAALNQGHHPAVISGIMKLQATELFGKSLPFGAGRHHGGGRQYPDPQPDRVRAGRDPRASLSAGRDERAWRGGSRQGAGRLRHSVLETCRS
jgi:acyl-CoA dehydrogenase